MTFRQRIILVVLLTASIAGRWGHGYVQRQAALEFLVSSPDAVVYANDKDETHDCDLVHVNFATVDELMQLPGVGPVLAERILETRDSEVFVEPECLLRVPGIGPVRLERIAPLVCFVDHAESQPE